MRQRNTPSLATIGNFTDATPQWKSPEEDKTCYGLLCRCHYVLVGCLAWIDSLNGRFERATQCQGENFSEDGLHGANTLP